MEEARFCVESVVAAMIVRRREGRRPLEACTNKLQAALKHKRQQKKNVPTFLGAPPNRPPPTLVAEVAADLALELYPQAVQLVEPVRDGLPVPAKGKVERVVDRPLLVALLLLLLRGTMAEWWQKFDENISYSSTPGTNTITTATVLLMDEGMCCFRNTRGKQWRKHCPTVYLVTDGRVLLGRHLCA